MKNLRRVQGILEGMEQLGKVVDIFLNTSEILAFVWGPMKFLLLVSRDGGFGRLRPCRNDLTPRYAQTARTWADSFDILLEAYQSLGENFPLLHHYAGLFRDNKEVENVLGLIYEDILRFHSSALRMFSRSSRCLIYFAILPSKRKND